MTQQLMLLLMSLLVLLPLLVFWGKMFSDMSNNDDLPREAKLYWTVLFLFFNVFAAVYYYVTVYRNKRG
jgi:NADH:ubiquinone oxidoreductase subunit 2 (subunit N)